MIPETKAARERNEEKWWNEQPAAFRESCEIEAAAQAARNADHAATEAALAAGRDKKLLTMVAENAAAAAADPGPDAGQRPPRRLGRGPSGRAVWDDLPEE